MPDRPGGGSIEGCHTGGGVFVALSSPDVRILVSRPRGHFARERRFGWSETALRLAGLSRPHLRETETEAPIFCPQRLLRLVFSTQDVRRCFALERKLDFLISVQIHGGRVIFPRWGAQSAQIPRLSDGFGPEVEVEKSSFFSRRSSV